MNAIGYEYKAVVTSKEGIRRFILACRLAAPADKKQEEIAALLGISRSTFAALLDLGRLPKSSSIPLESYVNMLRLLKPTYPGTDILITEDELYKLIIVNKDSNPGIESGLAQAIKNQISREELREGGQAKDEIVDKMALRFTGLPRNGINYDDGETSIGEAKEKFLAMMSGNYLPEYEIELAILSAIIEREDGRHDPLWIRWLCGLMPATYKP